MGRGSNASNRSLECLNMTAQIFLYSSMTWTTVINESAQWYAAIDIDGVNVIVAKDGLAQVRVRA